MYSKHASETQGLECNFVLQNNSTLRVLFEKLEAMLKNENIFHVINGIKMDSNSQNVRPTLENFQRIQDVQLGECYDILQNNSREQKCDSGHVWLIDCFPRLCPLEPEKRTLEYSIVRSARISFDLGLKSKDQDDKLVRYLIRHKHTSPLETVKFTFKIKCPIFVARQILRHRTASINEISGRYSVLNSEFYHPKWKTQSKSNKQSSNEDDVIESKELDSEYKELCQKAFNFYNKALSKGVSRELARCVLPVSTYTEFYFTMDLNNLFKFFGLRIHPGCQEETKQIAESMMKLIEPLIPVALAEFKQL